MEKSSGIIKSCFIDDTANPPKIIYQIINRHGRLEHSGFYFELPLFEVEFMKMEPGYYYDPYITLADAAHTVGTVNTDFDLKGKGSGIMFGLVVADFGDAGTIAVTFQESTDNSTWVDKSTEMTLDATSTNDNGDSGDGTLFKFSHLSSSRYLRIVHTIAANSVTAHGIGVIGPKPDVDPVP